METIVGTIDKIVFQADDSGYKIFILQKMNRSKISVQGEFPELFIGTKIEAHGEYTNHKKYGKGFRADAYTFSHDDNPNSIKLYLQSIAKWIGPERSKTIVDRFGTDLEKILGETPERLCEIEGIGETSAKSLAEAWLENKEMKNIRIFLQSLGLTSFKIKKVISSFGPKSEELLRENPYLLSDKGFGFSTCDSIAQKLKIDPDADIRYKYFVIQTLKECLSSGHLFLLPNDIILAFNRYNKLVNFQFNKGKEIYFDLIKPYLRSLRDEGYIHVDGNKFYDLNSFFYESDSARITHNIMQTKPRMAMNKVPVEDFIKSYEKTNNIEFSPEQKDAITSFTNEKIMVVTGSPGTGKTTVLKAFVQLMIANNVTFELLTPTGISAKKLGDTANHSALTIHRRLGYKGSDWDYGADNKYSTDVVIVDETSMVDMEVYYRLVSALYPYTKLVFVGDYDQLPSVGPGCVLRELVNSQSIKTVFLSTIFRQSEQSDIIQAAIRIKEGDTDLSLFKNTKESDIWFIRENKAGSIEQIIIKFAKELKSNEKLKANKQGFQIITPRNTGPLSVETLNIALQSVLNPPDSEKKEVRTNSYIIRKGDRVIIKKNNYDLGVFNGDIGKVINISPGHVIIDIDDFSVGGKRRIDMPIKLANDMLKLAYAVTVHKCAPINDLVYSNRGILKLKDLKKGDYVLTDKGNFGRVIGIKKTGLKEKTTLKTKTGGTLNSSKEHRHLVASSSGIEYKKAKDIKIGDFLCSHQNSFSDKIGVGVCKNISNTNHISTVNQIQLDSLSDRDFGWLMGVLVWNGDITDKISYRTEVICHKDTEVLMRFEALMSQIGLKVYSYYENNTLSSKYVCSLTLKKWLYDQGLKYGTVANKKIPHTVLEGNHDIRIGFIEGLIDMGGSISCKDKNCIKVTTPSNVLAHELGILYKSLDGIISFTKNHNNKNFSVGVFGHDATLLCSLIELTAIRKQKKVLEIKKAKISTKTNHYEIPFGKKIIEDFKDNYKKFFSTPEGIKGEDLSSQYKKLSLKLNAILRGVNKFRKPIISEIIEFSYRIKQKNKEFTLPHSITKLSDEKLYFDEVIMVIKSEKVEMIDIEVEGDESFVLNGYITHNSQGLEYPLVILPFIKAHGNNMLQRNLLYTAITRAKKKVIVLGQGSAIQQAIKNDKIQRRNTVFGERVKLWMNGQGISLREHYGDVSNYQNAKTLKQLLSLEGKTS